MNAKNCMLCGRPLGRIRVGAGGDFCSREHRNQYRLRRGMDCLTEANKVSTLARRRENPKALFAAAAPGNAKAAPRGFLEAPSVMLSAAGRPAALERRVSWNFGGRLPKAGMAQLRHASAGSSGEPRAFGMKLSTAVRPVGTAWAAKPAVVYQTALGGRDGKLRKVAPAASMGNAFRVSARVAFRQPPSGAAGRSLMAAGRAGPPAANGLAAATRTVPLLGPSRVAAAGLGGSRMAYGEMGFTGSPDAPAPVEWVGLVFRKGLGREARIS
ncbi:MAG: hypothetical protein ABSF25_01005 [Bryobacteraceae bacterium]|jgi:hypothetical protein